MFFAWSVFQSCILEHEYTIRIIVHSVIHTLLWSRADQEMTLNGRIISLSSCSTMWQ